MSNRAKSMMGLSELQSQGSSGGGAAAPAKKGLFGFLSGGGKNRRASVQIGGGGGSGGGLGGLGAGGTSGGGDEPKLSRRLSMPGLASLVLASKSRQGKPGKSARLSKGGKDSADARPSAFVIRHPRFGRREYEHHFVALTAVVATWNVGGHAVSYSDLSGLKKWLLESLPTLPEGGGTTTAAAVASPATGDDSGGGSGPRAGAGAGAAGLPAGSRASTSVHALNCPDIYVLGLQEIVDFNAKNVVLSSEESQNRAREWLDILQCILPREHKYQLLTSKSMVGIFICVFVKGSKLPGVSAVRSTNVGVGLLGKGGNKGSVAVSLRYGVSTLCFMTAHLAAHRDNVEGRCSDYKNIVARTDFRAEKSNNADIGSKGNEWCVVRKCPLYASIGTKSKELRTLELGETLTEVQRVLKKDGRLWVQFKDGWCPTKARGLMGDKLIVLRSGEKPLAESTSLAFGGGDGGDSSGPMSPSVAASHAANAGGTGGGSGGGGGGFSIKALDHDVVFLFGDLNFRLSKEIELAGAYDCIEAGDLDQLLEYDQLCLLQRRGELFSDWTEARVRFNPTFKYLVGSVAEYDRRPGGKMRVPAWCDRVMWQSKHGGGGSADGVAAHLYDHCPALTASDHKPVVSSFTLKVQRPVAYRCQKVDRVKEGGAGDGRTLFQPDPALNLTRLFALSGALDEREVAARLADPNTVGLQFLPPVFYVAISEESGGAGGPDDDLVLNADEDPMKQLRKMIALEDAKKARQEAAAAANDNGEAKGSGGGGGVGGGNLAPPPGDTDILFRFVADTAEPFLDHVPWTEARMPPKIEARNAAAEAGAVDVAAAVAAAVAEARADAAAEAQAAALNGAGDDGGGSGPGGARADAVAAVEAVQAAARRREAELVRSHAEELARLRAANSRLLGERDAAMARLQEDLRAQRERYGSQIVALERDQQQLLARFAALSESSRKSIGSGNNTNNSISNSAVGQLTDGGAPALALARAEGRIAELERRLADRERAVRELEGELRQRLLQSAAGGVSPLVVRQQQAQMQAAFDAEVASLRAQVGALIGGFRGLVPDDILDSILLGGGRGAGGGGVGGAPASGAYGGGQTGSGGGGGDGVGGGVGGGGGGGGGGGSGGSGGEFGPGSPVPLQYSSSPPQRQSYTQQGPRPQQQLQPRLASWRRREEEEQADRRWREQRRQQQQQQQQPPPPPSQGEQRYSTEQPQRYSTEQPQRYSTEQPQRYSTEQPQRYSTEQPQRYSTEQPQRYSTESAASAESQADQDVQWFYRTAAGAEVFGPFSNDDMAYWFENGDLPDSLEVRRGGGGRAAAGAVWQRLADLGPDPFVGAMAV